MTATMGFMSDLIENLPFLKARRREFNRLSWLTFREEEPTERTPAVSPKPPADSAITR
jgi:hypothetical protein